MLTTLAHRDVSTSNTLGTAEFSIKANGKAFKVLIDGLYSDKARAVVRELWSNAFDSHIAAGCPDQPFDCHLPTVWEPWFTVRDYGVSMTHVGVMRLYTTVFESSKEDTNTQVGKLGLGSKSPFAYTDTFTVTAYLDGEKRTYSAFIGADYIPRISHMNTEQTTEPNGLEVSFPVKTDDIANFSIAAQRTALGFDVLPNIVGSPQLEVGKKKVILEGNGWKLYDSLGGQSAHAKQGCVVYPITASAISGLPSAHWDILNSPFLIEFPIGDLEIAASREGLGYDDTTISNIRARLCAIETELIAAVEAQIASIKTPHELMLWMANLGRGDMPKAMRAVVNKIKWRGRAPSVSTTFRAKSLQGTVLTFSAYTLGRYVSIAKQPGTSSHISYTPNTHIVCFRDTSQPLTSALVRAHLHMKSAHRDKAMIYVAANLKTNPNAFKRLLVALGRPDPASIVLVNNLPAPTTASVGVKRPVQVREFPARRLDPRDWTQTNVDASAGGVYIDLDRFSIQDGVQQVDFDRVMTIVKALTDAGLIDGKVYAIPRSLAKKFLREENGWVNLFAMARELLAINFDASKAADRRHIKEYLAGGYYIRDTADFAKALSDSPETSRLFDGIFRETVQHYADLRAELEKDADQDTWLTLAGALNMTLPSSTRILLPPHPLTALDKRYPMLLLLITNARVIVNQDTAETVINYVNLVDACQ